MKNKKYLIILAVIIIIIALIITIILIQHRKTMKLIEETQSIQVFIENEASEEEIRNIGKELENMEGVKSVQYISKEETYNTMKNSLANRQELLEGLEPSIFSAAYIITFTDSSLKTELENKINQIEGIKNSNSNINELNQE